MSTKQPPPRFDLGDRVVATERAVRRDKGRIAAWECMMRWESAPLEKPRWGVFVGVRYYQDGNVRYHGGDDGTEWRTKGVHQVYLVAFNPYQKPLAVFPEFVFAEEEWAKNRLRLTAGAP